MPSVRPFRRHLRALVPVLALLGVGLAPGGLAAAEPTPVEQAILRGSRYLAEKGQAADGSFSAASGPAVTALVVAALAESGTPIDDPVLRRGLAYLLSFRRESGGIHTDESAIGNYETAIALLALAACNRDGRFDGEIAAA